MKVHVNTENLKSKNEEIKIYLDNFANGVLKTQNDVDDFRESWNDAGYQTFNNKMRDFFDDVKKLQTALDTYTEYIDSYVKEIDNFEQKYSTTDISLS